MMCDTLQQQVNYLLPESIELSKGSNTVVNLLYHNFSKGYEKITELSMHADNCIGQNKNNLVLFFLNFLILTSTFLKVELNFIVKGHTKFLCDRCFGLLKKKYRTCCCDTLNDLVAMIEQSTPDSHTNTAVMIANEAGDLLINMYDWVNVFAREKWRKVPNITTYSHFVISNDDPGYVYCRVDLDSEPKKIFIVTLSTPEAKPEPLHIDRFGRDQQKYLFKEIRKFCSSETAADILCPKPELNDEPPANGIAEEAVDEPEVIEIPKRKRGRPCKNKEEVSAAPEETAPK